MRNLSLRHIVSLLLYAIVSASVAAGLSIATSPPWCATGLSEMELRLMFVYPRLGFLLALLFWLAPMWVFARFNMGVTWPTALRALLPAAFGAWLAFEFVGLTGRLLVDERTPWIESLPLAYPTTSQIWPILFLLLLAGRTAREPGGAKATHHP